jgi:ankyrin repeat protein
MGFGGKGKGAPLRFPIGSQVLCQTSDGWEAGTIVDHWYTQQGFPPGFFAPYQVQLNDGTLIFVPEDIPQLCRERVLVWWEKAFKTAGRGPPEASMVRAVAQGVNVDERDCNGTTALAECARNGWHDVMRVLLDLGATAGTVNNKGETPLHLAVAVNCRTPEQVSSAVKALLEARADPNVQDRDLEKDPDFSSTSFEEREKHRTALHYCAAWDYTAAAQLLLEAGTDPNIIDGQYKTPLHLAIEEESSKEMVSLLLAGKSDPDKGNMEIGMNSSYLIEAARNGDTELAAALINAKANIDLVGKNGMTPLIMAVRCNKANVAQLLIDAGCDTTVKAMGKTAGEFALKSPDAKLKALLGADASAGPDAARKDLFLM